MWNCFRLLAGGLRYAATTGYYLTAFQAEDVLATFSHSLVSGVGLQAGGGNESSRLQAEFLDLLKQHRIEYDSR